MQAFRIGTCSWKYPSWAGLVYSRPKGIDHLAEYARKYATVEVDQWFWSLFPGGKLRLPEAAEALAYRRSVPDTFRFSVKAPNSLTLTHPPSGRGAPPGEPNLHFLSPGLLDRFLAELAPLRDVLGPILFQFGYLNRQKMASQGALLEALGRFAESLPAGFTFGVELRNPNYLDEKFFDLLAGRGLCPVLLEGYWMQPVADLFERHRQRLKTFSTLVLRLHGPDREGIEDETGGDWSRIVHPRDAELQRIAAMLEECLAAGQEVYVNVNNHFEGSAPLTIERLLALMGKA